MTRTKEKVAYATFYSSRLTADTDEDPYFDAVQLLIWQLCYSPKTRTHLDIPVLVFVVPHVSEARRNVFRNHGAEVIELDYVQCPGDWIRPRRGRWIDQLVKLRIFEQVSYDRILYLDSDMLLTRSLDAIWDENVSKTRSITRKLDGGAERVEGLKPMPATYLFVGVSDTYGSRKPDPPIPWLPESINAGFWLAAPCLTLFNFYISHLSVPGSFDGQYMEQGVFRHVHRDDGPMPWNRFEAGKWNVNWPRVEDLWRGTATLHDRFWVTDEGWSEPELVDLWNSSMAQMRAYHEGQSFKHASYTKQLDYQVAMEVPSHR